MFSHPELGSEGRTRNQGVTNLVEWNPNRGERYFLDTEDIVNFYLEGCGWSVWHHVL